MAFVTFTRDTNIREFKYTSKKILEGWLKEVGDGIIKLIKELHAKGLNLKEEPMNLKGLRGQGYSPGYIYSKAFKKYKGGNRLVNLNLTGLFHRSLSCEVRELPNNEFKVIITGKMSTFHGNKKVVVNESITKGILTPFAQFETFNVSPNVEQKIYALFKKQKEYLARGIITDKLLKIFS
jgi:hypothetical protein